MIFDDLELHLFLIDDLQWQISFRMSYLILYFKSLQSYAVNVKKSSKILENAFLKNGSKWQSQ